MDRTCATTWALCAIGLAVAGWAAVGTPRPPGPAGRGATASGNRAVAWKWRRYAELVQSMAVRPARNSWEATLHAS